MNLKETFNQTIFVPTKLPTGFPSIDEMTGGLQKGRVYVVAGLQKSGKSSLVTGFVDNFLKSGKRVLFIDTELMEYEFLCRLTTNHFNDVTYQEAVEKYSSDKFNSKTQELVKQHGEYLDRIQKTDLKDRFGNLSFELAELSILEHYQESVVFPPDVVALDNLTSFSQQSNNKEGWVNLATSLSRFIDLAAKYEFVGICVIHTTDRLSWNELPQGIRDILINGNPHEVFDKTVTIVKRPSSSDVYGGNQGKSQISGGMFLVWRPFQKLTNPKYQSMTKVILEDFRDGKSGDVEMIFEGDKYRFQEVYPTKSQVIKYLY